MKKHCNIKLCYNSVYYLINSLHNYYLLSLFYCNLCLRQRLFISVNWLTSVVCVVGVVLAVRFETLTSPTTAFDHCRLWLNYRRARCLRR